MSLMQAIRRNLALVIVLGVLLFAAISSLPSWLAYDLGAVLIALAVALWVVLVLLVVRRRKGILGTQVRCSHTGYQSVCARCATVYVGSMAWRFIANLVRRR